MTIRYIYNIPRRSCIRSHFEFVNRNRTLLSSCIVKVPLHLSNFTKSHWNVSDCQFFSTPSSKFRKSPSFTRYEIDDACFVYLNICFSFDDVKNRQIDDSIDPIFQSHYQFIKANLTVKDIKKRALESFDTVENLQYYNNEQRTWLPIENIPNNEGVLEPSYKGRILHLRIPDYYVSFEFGDANDDVAASIGHDVYDDNDDRDMNDYFTTSKNMRMANRNESLGRSGRTSHNYSLEHLTEQTIRDLLKRLKENGYERSSVKAISLRNSSNNDEIFTKQWVQQESNSSTKLQSIILSNANALNHIVQCLHYDFLWRKADKPK